MKISIQKCLVCTLAILVLMSVCVPSISASEAESTKPKTLLALGDSLTTGYGLDNYIPGGNPYLCKSYINMIAGALELVGGQTYINHAVNGDKTSDLAQLLPSLESQVKSAELIIITIGGNDLLSTVPLVASMISGKNVTDFAGAIEVFANTPPEAFDTLANDSGFQQQMAAILVNLAANLQTIAGFIQAKAPHARVIFLKQYNPLKNIPGFVTFGEFAGGLLDSINGMIEKNCQAFGFEVVDVPSVIDQNAMELTNILQYDIHPNEQGHTEIAKLLAKHLGLSLGLPGEEDETQAPELTTGITDEETNSPEETTSAPEPMTTAPEETTAMPETEAPIETMEETTSRPETTVETTAVTEPESPKGCAASVTCLSLLVIAFGATLVSKKKNE